MNLPDLVGYFSYPTLAHNQTRGYFAAFPPLMPIVAVIDISGTNPFISATAIFDGQSVPVVVLANRLTAQFKAKLSDIGRMIDLQWTLRFAQNPTVITYIHRVLVIGNDSTIDPIPTLAGNPCNIPCSSQVINTTGYSYPLYFATSGVTTSYEGFGFVSSQISSGNLLNWCQVDAAGFIDVPPYPLSTFTGTPNWVERSRVCAQDPPRTSSDAFVFEVDENNLSPTFGRARQRTVNDPTLCPVGDTAPDWEDDGLPYCQPEPRNDCSKLQDQIDVNPISPTFNTRRTITLPPTPTDCEDCPPTSLLPDYQDTGEWRCVQPSPIGRTSDIAEKRQIDRNPYSPTFNQDIWVSIGHRPDLCPIDPNPCNREVWIDSKTPDCELITRCKFDPPRYESTRQKQQVQVNPALPNVGAIRWVDLPPSPEDATLCPVETCPIYVPVCPEQIRCKFDEPRISSLTERLMVDVNPNSPTVGQQVWQDYVEDPILCPLPPLATQFSLSSARLFACNQPEDYAHPFCISFYFAAGNNIPAHNNFGLFNIGPVPQQIRQRWNLARTVWELPLFSLGTINTPNWLDCGITNGTQEFRTSTRFDNVTRWAKVYHYNRAMRAANYPTAGIDSIGIYVWIGNDISNVTMRFQVFSDTDALLLEYNNPHEVQTSSTNAPYGIIYTFDCASNPSMNWVPHKNRQVTPIEDLPTGNQSVYIYSNSLFRAVGLFKFVHEVFISGELYAKQQGYIRNLA